MDEKRRTILIVIDGLRESGMTALAQKLSQRLGCSFVSLGEMFRGLAALCMITETPLDRVLDLIKTANIELSRGLILINGHNVTPMLYSDEVTNFVGGISRVRGVRQQALDLVRSIIEANTDDFIVVEGQGLSSIFSHADFRFFATASDIRRARRRWQHTVRNRGVVTPLRQILKTIEGFDDRPNAEKVEEELWTGGRVIPIDTTHRHLDVSVDWMHRIIRASMKHDLV